MWINYKEKYNSKHVIQFILFFFYKICNFEIYLILFLLQKDIFKLCATQHSTCIYILKFVQILYFI